MRFLLGLAVVYAVKVEVPKPNVQDLSSEEMLNEALAGRGLNWQLDEMQVDNELAELVQLGGNMTLPEAENVLSHTADVGGPLMLAEMQEIQQGKVGKADTKGADLFLKLMKSALTKKQDQRMKYNYQHRKEVEGFVKRLNALVNMIAATSKKLTETLAKRSDAWVLLKQNERLLKEERAKYAQQQRYHKYIMNAMMRDKASLERTKRLLNEGYNKTCPKGFFMFLQKCGAHNKLQFPALVQEVHKLSPKLRLRVQSDFAKLLGVPMSQMQIHDDDDGDVSDVEKDAEMARQMYESTIKRAANDRDFMMDDISAEEASSVEQDESGSVDAPLVEHNVLMSDVENQMQQDVDEVSFVQRADPQPAQEIIYPNCTKPKCEVLKPVVKTINDDLDMAIASLIRQISEKTRRWEKRTAQNKALTEQYSDVIMKQTKRHAEASTDFAKFNKEKIDQLKRLKKLYQEMDMEQQSWTKSMTINRNEMCALIMFRDSAITALKRPKITDCLLTKWKKSSSCTKECGGGVAVYKRRILLNASNEGVECPRKCLNASWDGKNINECTQTTPLIEKQVICNTFVCPTDCEMNPWSSFSKCNPLVAGGRKGKQTRTRSIGINEANKGKKCGPLEEAKSCFMTGGKLANCKKQQWLQGGQIQGDAQRFVPMGGKPVLLRGLWQINYESKTRAGCKRKPTEPQVIYKNMTQMKCTMGKYDGCKPLLEKEQFEKMSWNRTETHWIQTQGVPMNNLPPMAKQLQNPPKGTDYVIGCNSKGKLAGDASGHFGFITGFEINVNNNSFSQMNVACTKPQKMSAGIGKCYRLPIFTGDMGDQKKGWIVKWGHCKDGYYLTNIYAQSSERNMAFLLAAREVQCCKRGWPGGATR